MNKQEKRIRRARRTRAKIKELGAVRLCVHRSLNHICAQLISSRDSQVLVCASTLEKEVRSKIKHGGNIHAATTIGKLIAQRAKKAGVTKVAFDRSGYKYHGRVRALAEAVREGGIEF
ncbi:50S ribosomal protein L18 [Coxiella endosymbiont of Ornithodoros amblus]|uniref:50S ribosomal protein L18 n=1 Tax=Coxiella endosymbiont of Ornithodoros amblus TaxID=1656166 RepID=UPI00244DBA17|nr:50S ribosomal protein L18 [Coxiella endosymbiont of Ornithodoros amblus]MBW5802535.1 50S ribosomal protein L18 [Coxiella endosymbiont of Ornithodoros amblus]